MRDGKAPSPALKRRPERPRASYAAAAAVILAIEIAIAAYVKTGFIRHTLGDVLVVMLLYAALMTAIRIPRVAAAGLCFAFACAVEAGQAIGLVDRLGLGEAPLARIVIGTTFSWTDIAAYAAGAILAFVLDFALASRRV